MKKLNDAELVQMVGGCKAFGQARSLGAKDTYNPSGTENPSEGVFNIGKFFSDRKGENAAMNADWKADYC